MSLLDWGYSSAWSERFESHRRAGLAAARVVGVNRGVYELETETGHIRGELSGRLEFAAESPLDLPVTGDWVAITATDPALIIAVVERQSLFTRVTNEGQRQPLAANVDVAFLVCGLDNDWSPRRLDRYLALAKEAAVTPVAVLNKRDLCPDPEAALRQAASVAQSVLISAHHDDLTKKLGAFVAPGQTAALLGSSGAGKSTIVNALLRAQNTGEPLGSSSAGHSPIAAPRLGAQTPATSARAQITDASPGSSSAGHSPIVDRLIGSRTHRAEAFLNSPGTVNAPSAARVYQTTAAVRESDGTGRHTTTTRTLIRVPQNWLLLDMPGLRSVGVTGDTTAVDNTFADITALAANCRFANCTHTSEPSCAVLASANPERLDHYRQLLREAAYQHRREDASAARAQKEKWKKIHAAMKRSPGKRA